MWLRRGEGTTYDSMWNKSCSERGKDICAIQCEMWLHGENNSCDGELDEYLFATLPHSLPKAIVKE